MSVYTPLTWIDEQPPAINQSNLNHVEDGIESAHDEIQDIVAGTTIIPAVYIADHTSNVWWANETDAGGFQMWVDETDPLNKIAHFRVGTN